MSLKSHLGVLEDRMVPDIPEIGVKMLINIFWAYSENFIQFWLVLHCQDSPCPWSQTLESWMTGSSWHEEWHVGCLLKVYYVRIIMVDIIQKFPYILKVLCLLFLTTIYFRSFLPSSTHEQICRDATYCACVSTNQRSNNGRSCPIYCFHALTHCCIVDTSKTKVRLTYP